MNADGRRMACARAYAALKRWMRLVAPLVPAPDRTRWREEWEGELWYGVAVRADPIRWSRSLGIGIDLLSDALDYRIQELKVRKKTAGRRIAHGALSELWVAVRGVRRAPGFTAAVACTLGLGVGAAVTTFSVVDSLLLDPLPYPDADRTVILWQGRPGSNLDRDWFSPAQFAELRRGTRSFELLALTTGFSATVSLKGAPTRIGGLETTSAFMKLVGARAVIGRVLDARDDAAASPAVVMISHRLWERAFDGRSEAVGRALTIDGEDVEVVGVFASDPGLDHEVAPTIGNTGRVDVVRSLALSPELLTDRSRENYNIHGRLNRGVTANEAQLELDFVAKRFGEPDEGYFIRVIPLLDQVVGGVRRALIVMFAAVGSLLLIACSNVATLLMARASSRQSEMGIRRALGAKRGRLVRQLLIESTLLAGSGGVVGMALAFGGVAAIRRLGAAVLPRVRDIGIDGGVLWFSLAVTALTALLVGLVPAWRASFGNVAEISKSRGRGALCAGSLRSRSSLSSALVAIQIALSLLLLTGSGVLVRSFLTLRQMDPGFETDGRLTFHVRLAGDAYGGMDARIFFYERLMDRLRSIPGVEAVGGVSALPFGNVVSWGRVEVNDPVPSRGGARLFVSDLRVTLPGYFQTMEIPLVAGRLFDASDRAGEPLSVIVDENFADAYFPDRDPIGADVSIWCGREAKVVGVVGNVKQHALDDRPRAAAYLPQRQVGQRGIYVVIRGSSDLDRTAAAAVETVRELDPDLAVADSTLMSARISQSLAARRFSMAVMQAFGAAALLLTTVGVYALVSFRVIQAKRELALRVALGAPSRRIFALVLEQGLVLGSLGVGLGLAAATAFTRLFGTMLVGVDALDALTLVATSAILLAVTLIACYMPARRATRVEPLEVLRAH